MEWFGHCGKILDVDLTTGTLTVLELDRTDVTRFIGGAGLNAWLLYRASKLPVSPLDPAVPLIFGSGPLVGTGFPSSARSTFTTISPLTGVFGDANGGGHFGPVLKRAGFDHLVIRGAAERPSYLLIQPGGKLSLENADDVWGLETAGTDEALTRRHPGSMVACIGPAGEKLVRFANISTSAGGNSWSRTGVGAVMGSKKLKAIVVKGDGKVAVASKDAFEALSKRLNDEADTGYGGQLMARWGTIQHVTHFAAMGLLYKNNSRRPATLADASRVGLPAFLESQPHKDHGCFRCPLKCEKAFEARRGRYAGEAVPKYELGFACCLGLNLGIDDMSAVMRLTNRCNQLGLDIVEFGGVAGLAIDLFKQGILTPSDVDGLELDFGAPEPIEVLAQKVATREGVGALLADGVRSAAERIGKGADRYAIHMKGMCEPAHSCPLFILSFSVATRGGDHLKGMPIMCLSPHNIALARHYYDATERSMDLTSHDDKGRVVWWHENYKTVVDSLGTCFFTATALVSMGFLLPDQLAEAFRLATGVTTTAGQILEAGDRGYQVQKALNARLGVDRSTDRFTTRPEPDSWGQGVDLDHPGMLDEYYHYRGCSRDGLPLRERLEELDLAAVADDLEREGRLGKGPCLGTYRSIRSSPARDSAGLNPIAATIRSLIQRGVMGLLHSPRVVEFLTRASVTMWLAERQERRRLAKHRTARGP
ncbi:MAG: aldehyde ferredoxin oxidoreductase family protein [Candidatus Riflebacteria bacterium]|nr:aldehyde ferredoxin oxidoreductase family protein [Candidatus Riflebacteria bacterium]